MLHPKITTGDASSNGIFICSWDNERYVLECWKCRKKDHFGIYCECHSLCALCVLEELYHGTNK